MIDATVGDGHHFEPKPPFQLLEYLWQEGLVNDWGNLNGTIARGRGREDPLEYEKSKHNKSNRVLNDLRHFQMYLEYQTCCLVSAF